MLNTCVTVHIQSLQTQYSPQLRKVNINKSFLISYNKSKQEKCEILRTENVCPTKYNCPNISITKYPKKVRFFPYFWDSFPSGLVGCL